MKDLFGLEDDIARDVSAFLSARMPSPRSTVSEFEQSSRLVTRGTNSVAAYLAYLRGGQQPLGCRGLAAAQADYENAVELDSDFVDARLLGGRTMALRAVLCGESSLLEAMAFAWYVLESEQANPFIRAGVASGRAWRSSDKLRVLEEAYALPVAEYERWAFNALERPRLLEYEIGTLL